MKTPSLTTLKKYLSVMNKSKKKYITADYLSNQVGVYPEVIVENLEYFEPMLAMDPEYNLLDLRDDIQKYIDSKETKKPLIDPNIVVKKTALEGYESVTDFIYQKLSIGGIIDKGKELSEKDLRILKKLITEELNKRKGKR